MHQNLTNHAKVNLSLLKLILVVSFLQQMEAEREDRKEREALREEERKRLEAQRKKEQERLVST